MNRDLFVAVRAYAKAQCWKDREDTWQEGQFPGGDLILPVDLDFYVVRVVYRVVYRLHTRI